MDAVAEDNAEDDVDVGIEFYGGEFHSAVFGFPKHGVLDLEVKVNVVGGTGKELFEGGRRFLDRAAAEVAPEFPA